MSELRHPIVRYLLLQGRFALLLPVAGFASVVTFDVAGIGTLVFNSASPLLTGTILAVGACAGFAPLIFATGVGHLAK